MFKFVFWVVYSLLAVFIIWVVFELNINDLNQAIAYQTQMSITQVQDLTNPILLAKQQLEQEQSSFGNLDEFINRKGDLMVLYQILLKIRWQELSWALMLFLPLVMVLAYDLILQRKIKSFSISYTTNLRKGLYLHSLTLAIYLLVFLVFCPYAIDLRWVYGLIILSLFLAYKIRLLMNKSAQVKAIS